jgi:hypothetical protein
MYQIAVKYVYQMSIKYTNIYIAKIAQIWIFGLKIYHLATLAGSLARSYFRQFKTATKK